MLLSSWWFRGAVIAAVGAIAACGGGSAPIPSLPSSASVKHSPHGIARLTIEIPRGRVKRARDPHYISPSTQSMTVAVKGQPTQRFNLAPTSPGCHKSGTNGALSCSEAIALPPGLQTLTVSLYDRPNGAGDLLATAATRATIAVGANTQVSMTLDGVPATAAVLLGQPGTAHLDVPQGVATSVPVMVSAYDAKGNLIVTPGAYSSAITLADSDTSGATTLNTKKIGTPGVSVTLHYSGATLSSATITPSVGGAAQSSGAATLTLTAAGISEYPIPTSSSSPYGIAFVSGNGLWFVEQAGYKVGKVTTAGTITEYSIPTYRAEPWSIAAGPNGALWFTEFSGNKIGTVTTGGSLREYGLPSASSYPGGIAAGPDGALWFTEDIGNRIGRISTTGAFNEYAIPTNQSCALNITTGPDKALWFTEGCGGNIGRITTDGSSLNEYPIPTSSSQPAGIAAGPDGALWFTEGNADKIGRIGTDGTITNEYTVPTAASRPNQIVAGPDGALWFTETLGNKIGRITTDGTITEYPVPTSSSAPLGISAGPDAALWFTECLGNKIGRIPTSIVTAARRHHLP